MQSVIPRALTKSHARTPRTALALGVAAAVAAVAPTAGARSFVTLTDDGTIAAPSTKGTSPTGQDLIAAKVVAWYQATGQPLPDVISLWTTFPMDGSPDETLFDPVGNDVKGIGLESQYGGDGTFMSVYPPLRGILLHNDVTQLAARAQLQLTTTDGFAQYIFLLELTHNWGPALALPADGSAGGQDLIGFPFHWSFWMNAGGSPAGGNPWADAGAGAFDVTGWSPKVMHYSMVDLYIMGLAAASEVPPFGVLEDAVPPSNMVDPLEGGQYSASSFPYFGSGTFTATATERMVTMDDVVAANGPRAPDVTTSPKTWTLGIGLVVAPGTTASQIAADEAMFEPIAASMAPAFHAATQGRGTLTVVTQVADGAPDAGSTADAAIADAGAPDDAAQSPAEDAANPAPHAGGSGGGCSVGSMAFDGSWLLALLPGALLARRRRAARRPDARRR